MNNPSFLSSQPRDHDIRAEQARMGRALSRGETHSRRVDVSQPPKKFIAKGHDAQLRDAQEGRWMVTVQPMAGDGIYRGTISRRDKYTITILNKDGHESIIYKHAIESVSIERPERT